MSLNTGNATTPALSQYEDVHSFNTNYYDALVFTSNEGIVGGYPDGTYKIDSRQTNKDGTKNDSTEVGQWGISGDIYFSIFRGRLINKEILPVNPSNPYNYDAYKILQLNNEIFEYQATSSNHRFTAKRKPSNFQLFQ